MVTRALVPFNVSILNLTKEKLSGLREVTSLDITDGVTDNFHQNGLYSTLTFGKVGDRARSRKFAYINVKIPLFHPVIFRALVQLKKLYAEIIAGTAYVLWNDEILDFERVDATVGRTGFAYFVSHWKEIQFKQNKSTQREQNILLIQKYKEIALTSKVIVMPAGLRDVVVDDTGRLHEDEINLFYRKLIALSNTINQHTVDTSPELIDRARYSLQYTFNNLYETIENMVQGKKKLLLSKWATRRIFNGTRNVITAMDTSVAYLGAPGNVSFNNTIIGLYQMMKASLPVSRHYIRNGFLTEVFPALGSDAILVNKETLKKESVKLKSAYYDYYMTNEGIEKIITSFSEDSIRHKPLEINGYYIGLIYKGPDGTFKLLQDIDDVPESRDKKHVYPITFCELLYTSLYRELNKYPIFVTRYPVLGVGSIYPSKVFVKTTIKSEVRRELDDSWEPKDDSYIAYQFPLKSSVFINSLIPHSAKLDRLSADFDGDTCSGNVSYSDESIKEVNDFFKTKKAYVGTDGRFISSTAVSTIELVTHNLTGG